jgi:hypothetical protein
LWEILLTHLFEKIIHVFLFFPFFRFSAFSAFLKKYIKNLIPRKKFTKSGKRGKKGKREILEIRVFAAAPRAICDENGHNFKQGRPRRQPRNPVLICAYVVKSSGNLSENVYFARAPNFSKSQFNLIEIMNLFSSKFCEEKVMAYKEGRNQKQQTATLLQYFGKKPSPQKRDVKSDQQSAAVKQFLEYFCNKHKMEPIVSRSEEELYNEYYDWTMQFNYVGYKKQMFLAEVFKLQEDLPKNAMPLRREINISVLNESLLGKRKRE